jgi:hypothetical protein
MPITEMLALIPFLYALGYAIFGGVESGIPLLSLSGNRRVRRRAHFSPIWEATNLLLGLAMAAGAFLFPLAWESVFNELKWIWGTAAALIALRFVLVVINASTKRDFPWLNWTLVAISLALPAVLMQTVTVLLTGDGYLLAHPELAVAFAGAGVLLSMAVSMGFFYMPGTITRELARRSYLAAVVWVAVVLPLALAMDPGPLDGRNLLDLGWPAVVAILASVPILMWPHTRRYYFASLALLVGFGATVFKLIMPYAMRPAFSLDEVVVNSLGQLVIAGVFTASLVIILPLLFALEDLATPDHESDQ